MRQLLRKSLAGAGLVVLMAMGASAQGPYRGGDPNYRGGRDFREPGRLGIERVMSDLDRAQSNSRFDRGDRGRFDRARKEVFDFQRKWSAGRYDRRELDQAIASVQRVVELRSIHARDRAALMEDVSRMREFRGGFNGWRANGYR
jgi:hypothetical protein